MDRVLASRLPRNLRWAEAARDDAYFWWKHRRANWRKRRPHWQRLFIVCLLLACTVLVIRQWQNRHRSLEVTFLDVGQGESIFVRSPSGRTMLIDGGSESGDERADVGRFVIAPFLQARGVKKIDVLVITHADDDHCNGLLSVLGEVPVGLVLDGGLDSPPGSAANFVASDYLELKREIARRKIPIEKAKYGQRFDLGDGVVARVLAPTPPPLEGDNDNAAVIRLNYGATSFLFTADIEKAAEERLVRRGIIGPCTILKVAHHGSKTSTTPMFLQAASPQVAVISCGRYNRFGHPAASTLQRLGKAEVKTFRTDLDGAVEADCDRESCWMQPTR